MANNRHLKDTFGAPLSASFKNTAPNPSDPDPDPDDSFKSWLASTRATKLTLADLENLKAELSSTSNPFSPPSSSRSSNPSTSRSSSPNMCIRTLRGDPSTGRTTYLIKRRKSQFNSTNHNAPIPGFTGHRPSPSSISISRSPSETAILQNLSLSLGLTMSRADLSTYSPQLSTSNLLMAETAYLAKHNPQFTLAETAFKVKTSDFVKHQMRTMKFAREQHGKDLDKARRRASEGAGSPGSYQRK